MLKQIKEYGIKFTDLKAACAALNEADLLEEKIATKVGIKGEAMLVAFLDYIDSIPTKKTKLIPAVAADLYNGLPQAVFSDIAGDEDVDDADEDDADVVAASQVDPGEDDDEEDDHEADAPPPKKKAAAKPAKKAAPAKKKAAPVDEDADEDETPEAEADEDDGVTSECPTFKSGWDEKEDDCQECAREFNAEYEACKKVCAALNVKAKDKKAKAKTKIRKQTDGPKVKLMKRSRYGHAPYTMSGRIDDMVWEGATRVAIIKNLVKDFKREEAKAAAKLNAHVAYLRSTLGIEVLEEGGVFSTEVEFAAGYSAENTIPSRP